MCVNARYIRKLTKAVAVYGILRCPRRKFQENLRKDSTKGNPRVT